MKIGIDASRANIPQKTGTEWCAYFIIQELKHIIPDNHEVVLYTKEPLAGPLADLPRHWRAKVLSWLPGYLWTQLRLAWEMLWHKPDVLFVPAHTIPVYCPAKTYTVLHDIGFEMFSDVYSRNLIGPENRFITTLINLAVRIITRGRYSNTELDYHRWSTRLALQKAKAIITPSRFTKQEIEKKFQVLPDKIHVVYNSFQPDYKKTVTKEQINIVRDQYGITGAYLLFVGRLEKKKNIHRIVQAYHQATAQIHNPPSLVLAGKAGHGYDSIEQYIENNNLAHRVIKTGWVDQNNLPALMNGAYGFIFTTLYEGFGMPILEAMSSGTPVITSNNSSTKEIGANAVLLADPQDVRDIARAILLLISNTALYNDLVQKGYQRASQFSWDNTARNIARLLLA